MRNKEYKVCFAYLCNKPSRVKVTYSYYGFADEVRYTVGACALHKVCFSERSGYRKIKTECAIGKKKKVSGRGKRKRRKAAAKLRKELTLGRII